MFFIPFVLFVFVQVVPSSGAFLPNTLVHRAHGAALKHSAGLARDLRVAFHGAKRSTSSSNKARCVSSSNASSSSPAVVNVGNGTPNAHGSSASSAARSSPTKTSSTAATPTANSPWKLIESHQGNDFFSGWDFFTGQDPTHGTVNFLDQQSAQSAGLAAVNAQGHAIMGVETTPTVENNRNAIRITTKSNLNGGGVVLMDSVHMPTGCGTWPAFWMNGPNWPAGGEIDIVEGVNDYTNNQATIHTNPGCSIPSSSSTSLAISGNVVGGTDCAAADSGNQGCGVRAIQNNSFGVPFNNNGGGVYAMQWDDSGISVHFFARGSVPEDITAGAPQPDGWGTPMARWPATNCNPFTFFNSLSAIFDTTLCGDWAGGVWTASGIPGQEQSCAQRTGFPTCEAFVAASGSSFAQAYWEVNYVKIFQYNA